MSHTNSEASQDSHEKLLEEYRNIYDRGIDLLNNKYIPPKSALDILDDYANNLKPESSAAENSNLTVENKFQILLAVQEHLIEKNKLMQNEFNRVTGGYEEVLTLISHEFKNLLTTIQGYNILVEKKLREENRQDLLELHLAGDRVINKMFTMIDALLKMSLTERNLIDPEPRLLDFVEDIINPLQIELKFDLKNKKMTFSNKIKAKKTVISGDEQLIEIIMRNLLENAIRYGDNETTIELTVENTEKELRVTIKNSCKLLPENICDGIFEKFKTVKISNIRSGAGIGLYNVKNLLRLHNGDITCTASTGKWIQFKFFIPFTTGKKTSG